MSDPRMAKRGKLAGFTLMETVVAIFIFGLGMIGIAYLFAWLWHSNQFVLEEGDTSRLVSRATDRLVSEIRKARPGDDGSYPVISGNDFDLVFYSDVDGDGVTEKIHYFYEDNRLKEGLSKPSGNPASYPSADQTVSTVASYIVNASDEPIFYYYGSDYSGSASSAPLATPADPADIRLVRIRLYANINPNRAPDNINIESFAQLRNLNEYEQ